MAQIVLPTDSEPTDNPPVGYVYLFVRSDGKWATRSSSGVNTLLGTVAGGVDFDGVLTAGKNGKGQYSTITAALAAAVSGNTVLVGPGVWIESFTVPAGVTLKSIGGAGVTTISGALATGTRAVLNNGSVLKEFHIKLPTDAVYAVEFLGTGSAIIDDCTWEGMGALGKGVQNNGTGTLIVKGSRYLSGDCAEWLTSHSGKQITTSCSLVAGTVAIAYCSDGGEMMLSACCSTSPNVGTAVLSGVNGKVGIVDFHAKGCNVGLRLTDATSRAEFTGFRSNAGTWDIQVDHVDAFLEGKGDFSSSKLSIPPGGLNTFLSFLDLSEGDESWVNWAEFAVGRPEDGKELIAGEGDSSARGMNVLTSDSTATSTTEGGNLTDESAAAGSFSGSTFSFQGTAANHCIYFGSSLATATDQVKHWGLKIRQTVAAIEVTPKSFVYEIWDGAAWAPITMMSTHSGQFVSFANDLLIRTSITEHHRYGINSSTIWAKRTISGDNLYWSRLRIVTAVTTVPVFEQIRLHTSRTELNEDGTLTQHGNARQRIDLLSIGNIFGEEGGGTIGNANIPVGSGGIPTGWTHRLQNANMNSAGDAINFQTLLPRGIDTGMPVFIDFIYAPSSTNPGTNTMIMSVLPLEVQGVMVADPTGGTAKVPRTLANTETFTSKPAQTDTIDITSVESTKPQQITFGPFDVSDYYEGDLLKLRIEMDTEPGAGRNIFVLGVALSIVRWTLGEKL